MFFQNQDIFLEFYNGFQLNQREWVEIMLYILLC